MTTATTPLTASQWRRGVVAFTERTSGMATPIGDSINEDEPRQPRIDYVQEAPHRLRVTVNGRFFGSVYLHSSRAADVGARRFVDFGIALIDPTGDGKVESVFMTLDAATFEDDISVLARYMEPGTR